MVVEHHLHIHVNVDGDEVVPRWIDAYKVLPSQHDLRVVDDEEGKQEDPVERVNDGQQGLGRERGHRHHSADEAQTQALVQDRSTNCIVNVGVKGVQGERECDSNRGVYRSQLHLEFALLDRSRRGQTGANGHGKKEKVVPRKLVAIRDECQ